MNANRDRWLALGLLVGVVGVLYLAVVRPLFAVPMRAVNAQIAELETRDARLRGLIAQRPQIERRLGELEQRGGGIGFLDESSAELATAALIQRLERTVGEASPGNRGCAIVNRTPQENAAQTERYQRVTVQVRLRCGNTETMKVVHALESARPFLFIDALSISAQRYFAVPGADAPQEGGLDVTFDLYGYLRPRMGGADGQ